MDSKNYSHSAHHFSKQAAYSYHQIFVLYDFKVLLGQYIILKKLADSTTQLSMLKIMRNSILKELD